MKHSTRKILAICVALAVAAASTLLAVGSIIGAHAQSSFTSGISSVTDYSVPGSYPWGTAFDGSGRAWVAMPGCDLAPSCPSSTPPGKLALFDPNAQNWATIWLADPNSHPNEYANADAWYSTGYRYLPARQSVAMGHCIGWADLGRRCQQQKRFLHLRECWTRLRYG